MPFEQLIDQQALENLFNCRPLQFQRNSSLSSNQDPVDLYLINKCRTSYGCENMQKTDMPFEFEKQNTLFSICEESTHDS